MKRIIKIINILFLIFIFAGCSKEDLTYVEPPKRVYITDAVAVGTVRIPSTASGSKTVLTKAVRVFVNKLYSKDVTVSFTFSGTADPVADYTPTSPATVTVPAGSYFKDFTFSILNNPAQTTSKTVIITLNNNSDGFEAGLSDVYKYKTFTYTITP